MSHSLDLPSLEPLADLFKLLSDGTRLRILGLLARGERNVSSLCDELKLPQPTVSHHLGLLRMRNIILNRRSGKQVFYELDGHFSGSSEEVLEIRSEGYVIRVAVPPGTRKETSRESTAEFAGHATTEHKPAVNGRLNPSTAV